MFDSNLMLISSVEATVTGAAKLIGDSLVPETWRIHVPAAAGTTPKIVAAIQESDNNSTWINLTSQEITAAGEYYETVMSHMKYRRCVLTVTGTNPNFGLVLVGRVPAGHQAKY